MFDRARHETRRLSEAVELCTPAANCVRALGCHRRSDAVRYSSDVGQRSLRDDNQETQRC